MDIKYKKTNDSLTFYIYGELDECSSSKAKEMLDSVIVENVFVKNCIFNLSGLSFMDSTGIGLLIGRYKKLKNMGVNSYISGANFSSEKIIELSGLYNIMPKCWGNICKKTK